MPSIYVNSNREVCVGSINVDGSTPLAGDILRIGMPHNYRGTWRVVEREHVITGPRCAFSFIYVEPVDDIAHHIAKEGL